MKNGQTSVLFKYFVKNQLKKQDLRYSDLAEHLNLSLAAVKKIMTEGDFKLSRMESIASWLGFTLLEALQIIDGFSPLFLVIFKVHDYFLFEYSKKIGIFLLYSNQKRYRYEKWSNFSLV
jgi:hypothetical protein